MFTKDTMLLYHSKSFGWLAESQRFENAFNYRLLPNIVRYLSLQKNRCIMVHESPLDLFNRCCFQILTLCDNFGPVNDHILFFVL